MWMQHDVSIVLDDLWTVGEPPPSRSSGRTIPYSKAGGLGLIELGPARQKFHAFLLIIDTDSMTDCIKNQNVSHSHVSILSL